jgi:hypothetical protein
MLLLLFQAAQAAQPSASHSILIDILKATVPGIVVAVLGLLTPQIRNAVFYKRTEYDFEYLNDSNAGPCKWDIQWEGYRLTIKVEDISNDKIDGVTFIKDEVPPGETIMRMLPSEKFRPLFDKELYVKLNSIIRFTPSTGERKYILRFVLRRKIFG